MRSIIGNELYAVKAKGLYVFLPNFESFDVAVKIVDVHADNKSSSIHWGTKNRDQLDTEVGCVISYIHSNERKKGKDCEIVHYDKLSRLGPDRYAMGQDVADAAKE
jgi:hypothetical protein